jgi:pimeloyl-ACP methyl ester carboxylesterase
VLIWGAEDPQVPLGLGQLCQDVLVDSGVDSRLLTIDGAGHAPFVKLPATFDRLLLEECPPGAPSTGS